MKYKLNNFLIVEGNNDKAYLSSFLDAEIITTNGYDVFSYDLPYIKELLKKYQPIILVDSDDAGKKIRKKLNEAFPNAINVEVDIKKCNKNGKHGVAECERDEIINKLRPYFVKERNIQYIYNLNDLNLLGINNKTKRDFVSNKFNLGKCNAKKLIHRLSVLEISKDDILKVLKEF